MVFLKISHTYNEILFTPQKQLLFCITERFDVYLQ